MVLWDLDRRRVRRFYDGSDYAVVSLAFLRVAVGKIDALASAVVWVIAETVAVLSVAIVTAAAVVNDSSVPYTVSAELVA